VAVLEVGPDARSLYASAADVGKVAGVYVFVDAPVLRYSTGRQSMIHDLDEDTTLVHDSYVLMHRNYRRRHGTFEYRALQLVSKLLPLEAIRRAP